MNNNKITYIFVVIAMCGFAGSAIGMVTNTSGVFFTPMAAEFSVGRAAVALTLTVSTLTAAIIGLFVPGIISSRNMRVIFLSALVMMAGGTAGLAFCHNLAAVYVLSFIRGGGSGMIHLVTIGLFINNWFDRHNGTAFSLAMCFSGAVGALLSPIMSAVIVSFGWRSAYLLMAVLMVIFCMPSLVLPIAFRPEDIGMRASGAAAENPSASAQDTSARKNFSRSMVFAFAMAVSINIIVAFSQFLPDYAELLGLGSLVGALLVSICLAGNIVSKLVIGTLSDKIGAGKALMLIAGMEMLALLLILWGGHFLAVCVGSFFFGWGYGIAAVGVMLMSRALFGRTFFAKIYPSVQFAGTLANALAASLIGGIYDLTGSYTVVTVINIFLLVIVFICVTRAFAKREAY